MSKKIGLILGPLLFIIIKGCNLSFLSPEAITVIGLALWMVCWWITEAVSISVTALLPLIVFPLFNVMSMNEVGANYGSSIVFLFFGGFVLALALEKVNLHRRIALTIIQKTGTTPNRVILGFMLATAFMSMWISNTASTVVMLPIALSVIQLLVKSDGEFTLQEQHFSLSVMLGIAFSANAGGIATVIGTPPNSILIGLLENEYNIQISFFKWMSIGLPFSVVMIAIIYFILTRWMFSNKGIAFASSNELIAQKLQDLGPVTAQEKHVLRVFAITVFLWVFRTVLNSFFPSLGLSDTIISMGCAVALFAIPHKFKKGIFILEWKDTQRLAWGILILFGGGLALAKGMSTTGIVSLITDAIAAANLNVLITASLLILLMLFMTELMSNVALVAVLAPVVAGIALGLEIPILYLLIPVTMASSCAFMLPMATPPNAIVFASGYVKVAQMARVGIIINLIAVVLLIALFKFAIPLVF
ncbi:SLC13 family permease [Flavobacteriaceae bacterium]|nr:SLC13 family permease [Flavobacteriaceae bacterium]MDA9244575.1 SLC13 family permease [Flavobacteriaceae bacterium]MDA9294792.1 SLC13 family permease [Flavobacteriaceae bacterium]MDB4186212.1 SLC13 family permease [Flavobacteriaceae bacterium]MDC0014272.1 SLC13 family permease [Flavobacteriaceae bacterium]